MHLETTTHIPASPAAVWDVLADFERQREWMVDIRSLRVVSDEKRGVGTKIDATSAVFGLPIIKDLIVVTAWDPPRRMDVRRATPSAGLGRVGLKGTGSFVLEPEGDGATFTWVEDVEVPFGWLGVLAWRLVIAPHMRRVYARSMVMLESIVLGDGPQNRQPASDV